MLFLYSVLILLSSSPIRSIHEIQHLQHLREAIITPVSTYQTLSKPLIDRQRGMLKDYYGYLPYWVDTACYQYLRLNYLTHISYFSIDIDPVDGSLSGIPNVDRFCRIRDRGHDWGVRIHMTFTLFGSTDVRNFLNNASARINAVNNIGLFMTNYGIEGANIDFEFVTSLVRDSFNLFIDELATLLWNQPDSRKELYLAMPAVPEWYPGYDIVHLSTCSDGFFIMAYDFHYSGSSIAGPVSPCVSSVFWGQYCAAKTIGSYKAAGVSGRKMILGLPYYGYDWPTVSENIGSATTGTGTAVTYYAAFQNANTYGRLWDSYSQTPWYRYYQSQWHQCWYDDSVSLAIKFKMVNDSLIQGAGCWALGYDRDYDHIWNAIRNSFWFEPPTRHFTAEVIAESLYLRDGPDTNCNILATAPVSSKFVGFDFINNWYKVYFPSNSGPYYGWIPGGDGLTYQWMKGATQNTILKVNVTLLNVRTGPSLGSPVITIIANGQTFVIDSVYTDWARIFIPLINGYTRGWCYHPYTILIHNCEDYNPYACDVVELAYPPSVQENDTFSVRMKIRNTGFGPFDTLIYLKGSGASPFYYPPAWFDQASAKISGFIGLPNQVFYKTAVFRAPDVPYNMVIGDTFSFNRNNADFGPQVIVSPLVRSVNIEEIESDPPLLPPLIPLIFTGEINFFLPNDQNRYTISIHDVQGRLLVKKNFTGGDVVRTGTDLSCGVYFLTISNPLQTATTKLIKLR